MAVPLTVLAALYAPHFETLRRATVEYLLGNGLDLEVAVRGPIEIGFGWEPKIAIGDVSVVKSELPANMKEMSARRLSLKVPLVPLLAGQMQLHSLAVDGLRVMVDVPQNATGEEDGTDSGEIIGDFLRSGYAQDLRFHDAKLDYVNQESGFNLRYALR